ncbi:MAG: LapA family protein [Chlorobiaceae bacterium]|nr:LapA family protein [Chlorobiaceae bacterium]
MATFYLIFAFIISAIAVIFALQNTMLVTVSFLSWTISGSLSLVLLVTLAIGVLIGLLVLIPSVLKKAFLASSQRKRIIILENEVQEHKARMAELLKSVPSVSFYEGQSPLQ